MCGGELLQSSLERSRCVWAFERQITCGLISSILLRTVLFAFLFLTPNGRNHSLPANVRLLCSSRATRMKQCMQLHGFALLLAALHSQWIELAEGLQRRAMSRARGLVHTHYTTLEGLARVPSRAAIDLQRKAHVNHVALLFAGWWACTCCALFAACFCF